ncbi:MAG: pyridoxamine 5'-phosphate oxidase family protein [Nitrososphaerales archaeon]|nr:pyridoxamine 5'-phosphate oxidase family protein [Nitrososphaerales archaeon]
MPTQLVNFLQGGKTAVLATLDQQGLPHTALFSWVVAKDSKHVRLAIGKGSTTLKNIRSNGKLTISVQGPGMAYGVKGKAKVIKDTIKSSPMPCVLVELVVEQVKDDNAPGITITTGIGYKWDQNPEQMAKVESDVFEELRS